MSTPRVTHAEVLKLLAPKRSKFNVDQSEAGKLARTFKGIVYHSAAEASYAAYLELRRKAGDIREWERQVVVKLMVKDRHVCEMQIDFRVREKNGDVRLIDVKGKTTAEWKLKSKLFEAIHGYKITTVKNGVESV